MSTTKRHLLHTVYFVLLIILTVNYVCNTTVNPHFELPRIIFILLLVI